MMHPAPCAQSGWSIHEGQLGHADVRGLLDHHVAEMIAGSPPSACHVFAADALADPAIRFFALRDGDGALLGTAALKTLEPRHVEVKSMRAAPAALGKGVGAVMLNHLVASARAGGMTRLSLETGKSPLFAAAHRLYRRGGFVLTGAFGDYAPSDFTIFYTRII